MTSSRNRDTSKLRIGNFGAAVLATLIGVGIAAFLLEAAVRLLFDEPVQPRFVIDSGYGVRWNESNVDTRHYVPGDYDVRITTNSAGMRGPREYPVERVPGTRRVALLGDSFVFGYGVEDDEVVSAVLERRLNASAPPGTTYEVLNFAVSGSGQAEQLLTWRHRAAAYRPDVVVLFYFSNDIGNNIVSGLFETATGGGAQVVQVGREFLPGSRLQEAMFSITPIRWLFENSEAWNLIRNRLSSIVQRRMIGKRGMDSYDAVTPEAIVLTSALLAQMIGEIRASGAEAVVVNIPDRYRMTSNLPLAAGEIEQLGARYVDGLGFLERADYYKRDSHWRPVGHAKTVAELLPLLTSRASTPGIAAQ